jgi:hypothetical protein
MRARSVGAAAVDGLGEIGVEVAGADGSALTGAEFEGAAVDGDGRGGLVSDGAAEPAGEEHPIAMNAITVMNAEVRMPRPL